MAILPMFLFSGTFAGLDHYPAVIRWIVEALPLNHGVELLRALSTGTVTPGILWHVLYFAVMMAIGGVITVRRLGRLLLR